MAGLIVSVAASSIESRVDALELRLDARRKAASDPGQGDLFSAPAGGGGGQSCGASHIAPGLTCHKGTAEGKSEAPGKAAPAMSGTITPGVDDRPIGQRTRPGGTPASRLPEPVPYGSLQASVAGKLNAQAEQEQQRSRRRAPFLQSMPPMAKSKAEAALTKMVRNSTLGYVTRQELIETRVSEGFRPATASDGSRRLQNDDGVYLTERDITAAGMKYAEYLAKPQQAKPELGAADYPRMRAAAEIPDRQEDWGGRSRGQGKRVGGMVAGSMSDPPRGVKTYKNPQAAKGVTPAIWEELKLLQDEDQEAVIGALQAGHTEQQAFLLAYKHGAAASPPAAPRSKPEQKAITAQEVETPKQQAAFARQQQKQASAAGDQKGAAAWKTEERTVERNRLAAAMNRQQASQTGLFGVTEYDNTMPLFARRDAADPVGQMLQDVLTEQLPGSQVLDWEQHGHGVTSGRVAAEGLLYRFRCDGEGVGYRPAWDGLSERAWEARSQGFLEVRSGAGEGARMDFRKPKFTQLSSKRKCTTGYSCGSSCISLQKECRVTPKSAIGKQRLRQLAALAKEGDPLAKQQASAVETARLQKAFELREKRDVDKLKKLRERPEIAEFLRTGKLPAGAAGGAGGDAQGAGQRSSKVRDVSPDEIDVDPKRFQYKIKSNAAGEVGSLKGVQRWDENLAGVISVWEDPADGKTYVVNGHNRLGLAKRLGAESVTVRYLDAPNAKEARAIGAMQNIAEGAGTEIDAAKFFRDTGIKTQKQIEEKGLPLNSGKAERGLALAKLPAEMFNSVVQGDLSIGRGAIIGGSGLPMEKQREIGKMLRSRKSVSDGTLSEYVQSLAVSETIDQGSLDIFGGKELVDTGLARAELANGLRRKLAKERALFSTVSKSRAAEALQEKAGNVINQAESATVASEADQVLRMFDQMKNQSGPISSALNSAAARVQTGESAAAVRRELEELVIAGMQEELERAGLRKKPSNEAPTSSLFDSLALEDRLAVLQDRLDARRLTSTGSPRAKAKCATGTPCGTICLPPSKTCRSKSEGAAAVGAQLNASAPAPAQPAPAQAARRPQPGAAAAAEAPLAPAPAKSSSSRQAASQRITESLQQQPQGRGSRLRSAAAGFVEKAKAAGRALAQKLLGGRGGQQDQPAPPAEAAASAAAVPKAAPSQPPAPPRPASPAPAAVQKPKAEGTPEKGVFGKYRTASDDGEIYSGGKVALDAPLKMKDPLGGKRTTEAVAFQVESYPRPVESKLLTALREMGLTDLPDQGVKALEMAFQVGANRATLDYNHQPLPPEAGRRVAAAVFREMQELIKTLPDGQLVTCSAWAEDGKGDRRQKLYERSGFSPPLYKGGPMFAVVQGGKLQRIGGARKDGRFDADAAIDLEGLLYELVMLSPDGDGEEGSRDDTLEDRLSALQERLDARVKQAPGQMGLDLGGGGGQPCGASHIAPGLTCHKGEGATASIGQAEPAAQGPRRGSIADAMKQQIEAMKAADIRQMGMLAQQLFETSWQLDRKKKYKGMTKEEAQQDYLKEFAKKLQDTHERRASSAASAPPAQPAQRGSIAATMKGILETMKASDQRLEQLSKDVVDLRIKASGIGDDDDPAGGITGSSTRRIGPSGRRDGQEDRIGRLISMCSRGVTHANG